MLAYIVVNEGEIIFASCDEESAYQYAEQCHAKDVNDEIAENGLDPDNPCHLIRAEFDAGFSSGIYEVYSVDTDKFKDCNEIVVGDVEVTQYDLERFITL